MSLDSVDPPRLTELASDAPSELRTLFEFARRDVPSDAAIAQLAARVGPLLGSPPSGGSGPDLGGGSASGGAGAGAASGAAGAAGAVSSGAMVKAVGAAVVTGLLGGAVWVGTRQAPPAQEAEIRTASAVTERAPQVAPEPQTLEPRPEPPVAPAQTAAVVVEKPALSEPHVTTKPKPASSALAEAQILERARVVMKSDPQRALRIVNEHARLYPKGVLAQERDVITIEALRRSGQTSEAERRAQTFARDYPGSAHQRSIKRTAAED